jgi:hypothetical protein
MADNGQTKYMRNDNAFPRVFLVDRYRVFADRREIVREVIDGSSDMRRQVFLEGEPALEIVPDSGSSDSAWVIDYQADSVLVGVEVAGNKILVMTDNYFDAWQVYVDGTPAELLRAYGTFRAVAIPGGSRQVQFKYHSERYSTARLVTRMTAAYLVLVIAVSMFLSRRKGKSTAPEPEGES